MDRAESAAMQAGRYLNWQHNLNQVHTIPYGIERFSAGQESNVLIYAITIYFPYLPMATCPMTWL